MNNCMIKDMLLDEMIRNDYINNNTIYVNTEFGRDTLTKFCRQLRKLGEQELRKDKVDRKPIKIRISSYGGEANSMFGMISYMEYYKEKGLIIETIAEGFTASAGSKLLICGSKGHRYATRYGTILIHQTQLYGGYKTLQESREDYKNSEKMWEQIKSIFKNNTNLTDEEIEGLTKYNLDVEYNMREALEKGLVDHLI